MAKANNSMVFMVLMLSLLLFIFLAEGRISGFASSKKASAPTCEEIYGVQSGDTCFSVRKDFKLSASFFTAVNPNLDCDRLFVGQWLCISGSP